jgi:hypothetical protein
MIGLISALTVGLLLLIALVVFALRQGSTARDFHSISEFPGDLRHSGEIEVCPPELVARIFSREDWELISQTHSPALERLFLEERKKVALLWVRQTSRGIQQVMRNHADAAKQAADIRFRTELSLFLMYIELLLICETLLLLITTVGPPRLERIASYVHELSRQISHAVVSCARRNPVVHDRKYAFKPS